MKTKDVIKQLQKLDPNGNMDVIIAVDAGEGYVNATTIFSDVIRKQLVDGDEIDCSSHDLAIFIGDSNAKKSPKPKFMFTGMNQESFEKYLSEGDMIKLITTYGVFKEKFEKENQISTKIPDKYEIVLYLDNEEQKIESKWLDCVAYMGPLISPRTFNEAFKNFINKQKLIKGVDDFDQPINIIKA